MLTRRSILAVPPTLLARGVLAAPAERWTIATEYPATSVSGEGASFFAATAGRLSSGELQLQPRFDAPDGLRSATMLEAVARGSVTAADAFTGALGGAAAIFQLSALPFLTRSVNDTARLLAIARPAYQATLAARGLALLYATPWPPTGLWSRHPVPDAAALRGLRVRTYDAASTAVLQEAGAQPVLISFADALPRLRGGELDAVFSSGDGGAGARLWETLPHFTILNYAFPLSLAFCADRTLAALPPSIVEAVQQAARETEAKQFQALSTRVSENETRMRQNGVQIADAPQLRAALAQAAEPVIADWVQKSGPEGSAILATYRASSK